MKNDKRVFRKLRHQRKILNQGFSRSDGLYDIESIIIAGLVLKKKPSSITIDPKRTFTGRGTASVAFTVSKGTLPILDVTLRYKGDFAAMPSFLATMTSEYKAFLKTNHGKAAIAKL